MLGAWRSGPCRARGPRQALVMNACRCLTGAMSEGRNRRQALGFRALECEVGLSNALLRTDLLSSCGYGSCASVQVDSPLT